MLRVVDGEQPTGRGSGWIRVPSGRRDVGLMELVAALVGEPGADPPSGVHPTLAAVGGAVSDLSSPRGRRELRPLALSFPDTAHAGLAAASRLVHLCTSAALACPGERTRRGVRRLEAARRLARSVAPGSEEDAPRGTARWWLPAARLLRLDGWLYCCFVSCTHATEALAIVGRTCGPDRDRRLRALLVQCLTETHRGSGVGRDCILHPNLRHIGSNL
jgi:hypothetical protein